jgi:sugar/nucleoside kinase (ribokinase family)
MTVLTAGETMALLDPQREGPPVDGMPMTLRFAGAESNFAVALARLGVHVTWVSRLGRDPFGDMIESGLRAEQVDVRAPREDDARTGLFVKWRDGGANHVAYYRAGSAATRLSAADAPPLEGVRLVHVTGITMAISESARLLVLELARRAHERGIIVTFDPNFRPALPDTPEAARERQREVLPYVDWYLAGEEEAQLLWGSEKIPARCVLRVGSRGAVVDGEEVAPPQLAEVIDQVGAGDGFAAGFAYALLRGWQPRECANAGNVVAAGALAGTGDWETYPRLEDVVRYFEHTPIV